ncbi:MAG: DUF5379 domain-containing protein [archaeon]|nr:DUF5379 domain-containing protein [archaeon]
MDTTVKITSIHIIAGIVTAFISAALTFGWISFKNDVAAGIIMFIILYFVGQGCSKLYGDEVKGFSQWLWDGIAPFIFTWIIAFTFIYNYAGILF